jgi:hypothetical protein
LKSLYKKKKALSVEFKTKKICQTILCTGTHKCNVADKEKYIERRRQVEYEDSEDYDRPRTTGYLLT